MALRPSRPAALDYGSQRRPQRRAMIVAALALLGLALACLVFIGASDRASRMAKARAWTVNGPPCAAAKRPLIGPVQVVTFDDARFGRLHGAIRCAEIGYDGGRAATTYPVCQFDHPGQVQIASAGAVVAFDLGPLNGAVISVPHGKPRCVVGQNLAAE